MNAPALSYADTRHSRNYPNGPARKPETRTLTSCEVNSEISQMSQPKVLNELDAWRRNFALVRMQFLRENFRRPEQVAEAYGVRFQSALNWWNGSNAGSGAFVAEDFRLHPESAAHHYCRGRAA
jgi:hypothetical protein